MVRIRLPPATSLQTIGSSPRCRLHYAASVGAERGVPLGGPFQCQRPDGSPIFAHGFLGLAQGTVRYVGERVAVAPTPELRAAERGPVSAARLDDVCLVSPWRSAQIPGSPASTASSRNPSAINPPRQRLYTDHCSWLLQRFLRSNLTACSTHERTTNKTR
jgi:hypothetical protein